MALKARKWSALDDATAEFFCEKYEESGLSLRQLEEETGIRYSRLYSIFHKEHAAPLLDEFVSLNEAFGLLPSATLSELIESISGSTAPENDSDFVLVANRDDNKFAEMGDYYD